MGIYMYGRLLAIEVKIFSTWNVETGICTREWVCRFFSLAIPIGKYNIIKYSVVQWEENIHPIILYAPFN